MFNAICSVITANCFLSFVGLLSAFVAALYYYLTKDFGKWEKKYGIKGLKPVPFFGTEKDLLLGKISVNDYVLDRYKEFDGHKFGIMYQGSRPTIYVHDYELLKNICIRDFDHFTDFFHDGLDSIVDSNIFFMNGDKWKHSKGALSQVFRMKNVKDILPKLNFCIKRSMMQLDTYAKTGEVVRMDDNVIEPCLLDAVGHAVCGVNIDAARDTSSEFTQMVYLLQSSVWRFVLLTVAPEFMKMLRIKVFYPKAANYLDRLLRQLIEEHKRTKKHDDMMGVLLKVKGEVEKKLSESKVTEEEVLPLTEDMIISSVMQFFFDGVITIASMLSVAVYYLAQNPDIQEKAYEEIQNVLGDRMTAPDGGDNIEDLPDITDTDLMEMKYVEQIFEEAQRIAAFPFIFRTCTKDYKIPDTNFVVPKGTPVHIPILGFHMDPKHFPNPEKFDPERFSPENKGNIATGTFIPFGQGPRMCLGKNFIRIEGRCYLANLIRSFRILPSDKTVKTLKWDIEGQGKIKGGLWVNVERRDY